MGHETYRGGDGVLGARLDMRQHVVRLDDQLRAIGGIDPLARVRPNLGDNAWTMLRAEALSPR